jgi:hypothetical protein
LVMGILMELSNDQFFKISASWAVTYEVACQKCSCKDKKGGW